jgi:hypothetical protein
MFNENQKIMKAKIEELFDSGTKMIVFTGQGFDPEFDYPGSVSELKAAENVVIGSRKGNTTEVIIDDVLFTVQPLRVQHPSGGGRMDIIAVY